MLRQINATVFIYNTIMYALNKYKQHKSAHTLWSYELLTAHLKLTGEKVGTGIGM